MEVDRVFPRRKVVQVQLEGNARTLIPDYDVPNIFSLSVFEFNLGLGRTQRGEGD
jgi:hypothetical protein